MSAEVGPGRVEASHAARLFLDRLERLSRGERALLKRNAGQTIASSRNAVGLFYRILPKVSADQEEFYFLVATLYGFNQRGHAGNLGATMRDLKQVRDRKRYGRAPDTGVSTPERKDRNPIDRRMAILLDAEFDLVDGRYPGGGEMAYRLWQCVKLADSAEVGVNWLTLLQDLPWWSHPNRRVRKQWARAYFQGSATGEKQGSHQDLKLGEEETGDAS